ncbi:hypothetical protein RJ639_015454 [Escallonia herrerae]|uniref:Uncharacterized protein n=1 Tax=Escallonia herrerae TaxID=1293975 RepID=A0AA88VFK7_9ASTE|nr:hypothetical protein RJ639_015454 [Escallonia herrerae]
MSPEVQCSCVVCCGCHLRCLETPEPDSGFRARLAYFGHPLPPFALSNASVLRTGTATARVCTLLHSACKGKYSRQAQRYEEKVGKDLDIKKIVLSNHVYIGVDMCAATACKYERNVLSYYEIKGVSKELQLATATGQAKDILVPVGALDPVGLFKLCSLKVAVRISKEMRMDGNPDLTSTTLGLEDFNLGKNEEHAGNRLEKGANMEIITQVDAAVDMN